MFCCTNDMKDEGSTIQSLDGSVYSSYRNDNKVHFTLFHHNIIYCLKPCKDYLTHSRSI